MIDIQIIRDKPKWVSEKAKQKGYPVDVKALLESDSKRRELMQKVEQLRARRNEISSRMKGGKPSVEDIAEGRQVKDELIGLEATLERAEVTLNALLETVPNMPLEDVPIGASEEDNKVIKVVGEPAVFDFETKNHAQIAEAKGWLDKERAAKVAGSRFAYLMGDLVLLDWALNSFALSKLSDEQFITKIVQENNLQISTKPFIAVQPPAVAKTDVYMATGRLSKEEMTYKLADDDLWLNASAEHVLAPLYLGEILNAEELPKRYVGYTTAFRREAGTYGKDMEGFFRLHQFNKLEMESFTTAETSLHEHLLMVAIQEHLMSELKLPYRVVLKCTADIGKPNARGIDIDAWLPGQGKYRETHTADLITDFQARRMSTKVRKKDGSVEYVHTNDATALSQRPLIAIIENYQTREGDVIIPEVLKNYMNGREKI